MITTLAATRAALQLPANDDTKDVAINANLAAADAVLKMYCKRDLEPPSEPYVEYHSGRGRRILVLRQRPILSPDDIVGVWLDQTGYAGQGEDAFTDDPLEIGRNFMLRIDGSNGSSESAILEMIASPFVSYGQGGTLWGGPRGAVWPRGQGNIKVEYTAGYNPIPDDLIRAGALLCALMVRTGPSATGSAALTSESLGGYSYSLSYPGTDDPPEITSARQILSRYREVTVA